MFLLSAVGCKSLGGGLYLIADANYSCYSTDNYIDFLYFFTIPALLIWSLFPLYILRLLYAKRHKLEYVTTIKQFGYLYLEYKPRCYYFEFVRFLFKLAIVTVFTLVNSESTLKLDCIILLVSLYIIFCNKIKPFKQIFLALVD